MPRLRFTMNDSASYLLSRHVHVCLTGEHAVFLDLRRDKYRAIGLRERVALQSLVAGWPKEGAESTGHEDPQELIRALLDLKLLTTDRSSGKELVIPRIEPPTAVLVDDTSLEREGIHARDVLRFSISCARAALALRVLSLERVVDFVYRRKHRALERGEFATLASDRRCVASFNRLRPFAFTADTFCLYDSLALVEFLALHGSYPDWVIGVYTGPFAAHSWVQSHGFLFNGPIDHVARYTPILVV
jgi:hypothetical protein